LSQIRLQTRRTLQQKRYRFQINWLCDCHWNLNRFNN
jgi:hypothetical protein